MEKKSMPKIEKSLAKNMDLYLVYRQRAALALAKYEDKQQYPTNDKRACVEIMNQQIHELRVINADWIKEANTERGRKRMMYSRQFYDDFIAASEKHRDSLIEEIKRDIIAETVSHQIPSLWSLLKEWWNDFKKKEILQILWKRKATAL